MGPWAWTLAVNCPEILVLGLNATPNAEASRAASWMEASDALMLTSTMEVAAWVLRVPFTESGVEPSFKARPLDLNHVAVQVVGEVEIGGDGIADLHPVNHRLLQLQRTIGCHFAGCVRQFGA